MSIYECFNLITTAPKKVTKNFSEAYTNYMLGTYWLAFKG